MNAPLYSIPEAPRGFRAEDFAITGMIPEGFLPPDQAAEVMGVPLPELRDLVGRGVLEVFVDGCDLYVRPAIVSVLRLPGGKGPGGLAA